MPEFDDEEMAQIIMNSIHDLDMLQSCADYTLEYVEQGCMKTVSLLIDLSIVDAISYPDLMKYASKGGYLGMCELLLEHGWPINSLDETMNRSALGYAARYGHFDVVEFLLDNGADISSRDMHGDTALSLALVYHPQSKLIRLLLKNGADPHQETLQGYHGGRYNVFNLLMHFDISYERAGSTFSEIFNIFYSRGSGLIEPGVEDWDNLIYDYLPKKGEVSVLEKLYDDFPTIDLNQMHHGLSMLMTAARHGQLDMCRFLVEHGSKLQQVSQTFGMEADQSVLHFAVLGGNLSVVDYFIDNDVDVNALDLNHTTPLMLAASLRRKDLIELLISHGADVHLQDSSNQNALYYAENLPRNRRNPGNLEVIQDILHLAEHASPRLR